MSNVPPRSPATPLAAAACAENGGIAGLNYRNQSTWNADWIGAHTWNAAATYVSGANSIKVGYQGAYHEDNRNAGGRHQ